jgi:uncharacterized phage-associated protein
MSTCFDVARYILEKKGMMTAMKLQKLVYYAQAWSLVWDDEPLFKENIQAWINGPVVRELYDECKGKYQITIDDITLGDSCQLSINQRDSIDRVLDYYGDKSSQWLSDLTHMEDPWQNARKGLSPRDRGEIVITHADMANYYSSLVTPTAN